MRKTLFLTAFFALAAFQVSPLVAADRVVAFPGAEGYGRYATGGRGGEVCYVTRLDDCTDDNLVEGTLRWAIRHNNGGKPRTILFNTSGTIYLTSKLKFQYSDVSILGQSAPGGGICLTGYNLYVCRDNVILRYLRFRAGDIPNVSMTGLDIENAHQVIVDHCSMTWSMEECLTAYDTDSTTVQWCIIGEGLYNSKNSKGARAYATQWGGEHSTMHHTLITHSHSRAPRFNGVRKASSTRGEHDYQVDSEFANNVVFNWSGAGNQYGGEYDAEACETPAWTVGNPGYDRVFIISNYYRPGPATQRNTANARYWCAPSSPYGQWYLNGNKFEVNSKFRPTSGTVWSESVLNAVNDDNYYGAEEGATARGINLTGTTFSTYVMKEMPYALSGLIYETADEAYAKVTTQAGASLPRYDEEDQRLLDEAAGTRDPQFAGPSLPAELGIIDSPDDITFSETDTYFADGKAYSNFPYLGLKSGERYAVDSDADGLPDAYEEAIGLDKGNAADAAVVEATGYTRLETYLNGLADGTLRKADYETSDVAVTPGLAALPETVTYAFSTTGATEGVAPAGATVKYGTAVVMPVNTTLYKEGYTLTGWSYLGRTYAIGETAYPNSDQTFTPVFLANRKNISDRSQRLTLTWDFTAAAAPTLSPTAQGIYVNQNNIEGCTVDCRLAYTGTAVSLPWCEGATVHNGNDVLSYTVSTDSTAAVVETAGLTLTSLSVTLPYQRPVTTSDYHEVTYADASASYELVYTDSASVAGCTWIEVPDFADYPQRWQVNGRYGLDPVSDDGSRLATSTPSLPKVNGALGWMKMYVKGLASVRVFAIGSNSQGDQLQVTATPTDGSGALTAHSETLTKNQAGAFTLDGLDNNKFYILTFSSVNGYDMTFNAVKFCRPVPTGEGTFVVKWPWSSFTAAGNINEAGKYGLASATAVYRDTVFSTLTKTAYSASFTAFQPLKALSSERDTSVYIDFKVTPGTNVTLTPSQVSFDAVRFGTDACLFDAYAVYGTEEVMLGEALRPNREKSTSSETFTTWSTFTFDLPADKQVVSANFSLRLYFYNVSSSKQFGIKDVRIQGAWSGQAVTLYTVDCALSPAEGGTVTYSPSASAYSKGTIVTLKATPASGYLFDRWLDADGNTLSTTASYDLEVGSNTQLTAQFRAFSDYAYIFTGCAPYDAAVNTASELLVALNAAAKRADLDTRYRIFLHNGTYDLGTTAKTAVVKNTSLIGESMQGVLVCNNPGAVSDYQNQTPVLYIDQNQTGVYMQDLTVQQSRDWAAKKSAGQALALRQRGSLAIYKNVRLQGVQDTYYLNKADAKAYFETCDIAGEVDFIYGDGTAYFEQCTLRPLSASAYITAPNTQTGYKGMVFHECTITGAEGYHLGRPWGDSPAATFLSTTMEQQPAAEGWGSMTSGLVCRFHEWGSKDAQGNTLDLSTRSLAKCSAADGSDACVLADDALANYALEALFPDWQPATYTAQLDAPASPLLQDGTLTWTAVDGALGYAVVADGAIIDFTTEPTYTLPLGLEATSYSIRVANSMGGLSASAESTDGLDTLSAETAVASPLYNLEGQRLHSAPATGLYLTRGEKIWAK